MWPCFFKLIYYNFSTLAGRGTTASIDCPLYSIFAADLCNILHQLDCIQSPWSQKNIRCIHLQRFEMTKTTLNVDACWPVVPKATLAVEEKKMRVFKSRR